MSRRDEILAAIPEIPGLPAAAARVLALLQNPESGIAEVMREVESDPGLTADVLRLANSAYFAGPRSIGSLREAGVLMGLNRLGQLILASAIFPMAKRPIRGYDLPSGTLLRHVVGTAIGAEELAGLLKLRAPSHTFTAALLADIGKIVLGTFIAVDPEPIRRMAMREAVSFEVAERRVLGIDHAEAGAALLAAWNLPASVVSVVRHHHSPDDFEGDRIVVDLVHVADHLAIECGLGAGIDGLNYRPAAGAIARLGLSRRLAERASARIVAELESVVEQ